jgi:hypothetical protein
MTCYLLVRHIKNTLITAGWFDEFPLKGGEHSETNQIPSYAKKRAAAPDGYYFITPIHVGMFQQNLMIPCYIAIDLHLMRNDQNMIIQQNDNVNAGDPPTLKIEIAKIWLDARRVQVVPSVYQGHLTCVKSQNYQYHIMREVITTRSLAQGLTSLNWASVFPTSQKPVFLALTIVRDAAFTGSAKYNPDFFHHYNFARCEMRVNGHVTRRAFTPLNKGQAGLHDRVCKSTRNSTT